MGRPWGTGRSLLIALWALPLGGFLLIAVAFYSQATPLTLEQRRNDQPAGEIQGSFTVGQTFYSPYPGLYRIEVLLATYARPNTGRVAFHLSTGPTQGRELATVPFEASLVEDNRFRSFEFPAQGDSAGKTYFFYLEAPGSGLGNAITAWSHSANPYPLGMAVLGGQPVENDLTFVAYFQPSPWQLADIYLGRLARGKPGLWGSKAFYGAIFLVYLGLVGGFLGVLFRLAWRQR